MEQVAERLQAQARAAIQPPNQQAERHKNHEELLVAISESHNKKHALCCLRLTEIAINNFSWMRSRWFTKVATNHFSWPDNNGLTFPYSFPRDLRLTKVATNHFS